MALNPVLKAFFDQIAAMGGPKTWEMAPRDARDSFAALMQLAGPQNIPIGKVSNLQIPAAHGAIPARLYTPVNARSGALPCLVFFHGGGWVIGNIETHDGLTRILANESGCSVISVDYRLAPEHKFPTAVDDAFTALEWIAQNAAQLGIDPSRLGVGGDSAGGALAAVMAQMANAKHAPKLRFQLLLFPVTQIGEETASLRDFADGFFLERRTLEWFYAHYLPAGVDRSDPRVSPLLAKDVSGLPSTYIMLAQFDPLHDEGAAYAQKLKEAGVPVTVRDHDGMVHDFIYLQAILPQAGAALRDAAMAVKLALNSE